MKKFLIKSFVLFFLCISIGATIPKKASAFDYSELLPISSPEMISDAIQIKVITKARIEVTVNLDVPIFANTNLSRATFRQAFTGTYVDTNPDDSEVEFEYTNPTPWGENDLDDFRGTIFIAPPGQDDLGAPLPNTVSEIASLMSSAQFELKMGIRDDVPGGNSDKTFYYSDGGRPDGDYDWNELEDDTLYTYVKFPLSAWQNSQFLAALYYMKDKTLIRDGVETANLTLCPLEGYAVNFIFQDGACDYTGGTEEIVSDPSWTNTTEESIYQQLAPTGPHVLYRGIGDSNGQTVGVIGADNDIPEFTGGVATESTCESEGGVFSFILCPALEYANDAIGWLDDRIVNALVISDDYYAAKGIKDAWANVRNVAYIILIPILLFMVIGTALQFNFLDAYTVKRALPRLFVAIIFMSVSYDICRIMIEIVNGVGRGISGIIAIPFGGFDNLTLQNIFAAPSGGGNFIWGGILAGVAIASLFVVSVGILFSYLFVAALALLLIFILLSIRELMIIFLIILSPLAIIAWVFPGNDKMWKLWWGTFSKLLYIFPIIMGLLTVGRAFALTVTDATTAGSNENGVVLTIVKLTAFIGPYFFIPKAFQMAGGAFANLAGMVNDRGKGMFDRQRKYRQAGRKALKDSTLGGNRFKNARPGSIADSINKRAQYAGHLRAMGVRGALDSKTRRQRIGGAIESTEKAHKKHLLEDAAWQDISNNDDYMEAMTSGNMDEASAREYLSAKGYTGRSLDSMVGLISQLRRDYGAESTNIAAVVAKARSKTSYTGGIGEMLKDIKRATHGNTARGMEVMAQATSAASQAGRYDLGGGSFGDRAELTNDLMSVFTAGNPGAEEVAMEMATERMGGKVLDGMTIYQLSAMHPTAARRTALSYRSEMERAVTHVNQDRETLQRLHTTDTSTFTPEQMERHTAEIQHHSNLYQGHLYALGQRAAEIKNLQDQASVLPPEVGRAFAAGLNRGGNTERGESETISFGGAEHRTAAEVAAFIQNAKDSTDPSLPFTMEERAILKQAHETRSRSFNYSPEVIEAMRGGRS